MTISDQTLDRVNKAYFLSEQGYDMPSNMETSQEHREALAAGAAVVAEEYSDALTFTGIITVCRECRDERDLGAHVPYAEFILWGKLFPEGGLGPKCYNHAVKWTHHDMPYRVNQWAVVDVRPLLKLLGLDAG